MAGMLADHPLDTLRIRQQQPSSPAIRHQSSCPDRKRACAEPEEERKEWEEEAAAGGHSLDHQGYPPLYEEFPRKCPQLVRAPIECPWLCMPITLEY
ncbi:hypothetical protein OsJ_06641 [Oryza sativa Japonica Group]|uniref:Uncharacterized protein n=1 Tax=Oryza sativa subsp. japonica TaxID=39947 RepID=Q6K6F0_ORYSJ|nr:hypothetical protein OsJ_06641 [Oryza sativa Japonica Group]BAD19643.1 hypothetical protein [Oryza sativa Japonica Group]BAD19812.1 hypothetical protein [Oryza sativa Japonica Group]